MSYEDIKVVVIVGGDQVTQLPTFLSSISQGVFKTPETGYWRDHDRVFHFARLASLQTEDARLAMDSACIGLQLLKENKPAAAIEVADMVDGLLSVSGPHTEERKYLWSLIEHHNIQGRLF